MNDERAMLLRRIQICDFVLNDTALFLDLNPRDTTALNFYKKYNDLRKEAADEYTSRFGPLRRGDFNGGERWEWTDSPWPWQNEED